MGRELKAIKINNAVWLPAIAEHIERFCKRAHVDGIQPGNLQTYFAQVAQGWYGKDAGGRDFNEFWMVFEDDKPVAFAQWQVLGLPYIATVHCGAMHSWTKNTNAVDLLIDECIKFGERWNAVFGSADLAGKGNARLFTKRMMARGFIELQPNLIKLMFRRK